MRKVYLSAGESVVSTARLDILERKEVAHDSMMRAWATLADIQSTHLHRRAYSTDENEKRYQLGWLDCFGMVSSAVSDAAATMLTEPTPPRGLGPEDYDSLPF